MGQGWPSSPSPKSCMQPLQASSSTYTPTSMHPLTDFSHLGVLCSNHVNKLHLSLRQPALKSAFYIHTSAPFNRDLVTHISSSLSYGVTSSKLHPDLQLTPYVSVLAQGGLGQGMRRGMYPGGGNSHCRGPARAGLACCHRQTWVWWDKGRKLDVEELEGRITETEDGSADFSAATVENITVSSWWITWG